MERASHLQRSSDSAYEGNNISIDEHLTPFKTLPTGFLDKLFLLCPFYLPTMPRALRHRRRLCMWRQFRVVPIRCSGLRRTFRQTVHGGRSSALAFALLPQACRLLKGNSLNQPAMSFTQLRFVAASSSVCFRPAPILSFLTGGQTNNCPTAFVARPACWRMRIRVEPNENRRWWISGLKYKLTENIHLLWCVPNGPSSSQTGQMERRKTGYTANKKNAKERWLQLNVYLSGQLASGLFITSTRVYPTIHKLSQFK